MFSNKSKEEQILEKIEDKIESAVQVLKKYNRRLDRYVNKLDDQNAVSKETILEIRKRVYDFQMMRGLARSEYGIKTFGELEAACSFRRSMFQQFQRNLISPNPIRPFFEDKILCYEFMDRLGVRRPKNFPVMTKDELVQKCQDGIDLPKYIVKPLSSCSSKGVYLVGTPTEIITVKGEKVLKSFDEMKAAMQKLMDEGKVETDEWFIEEAITISKNQNHPGRDLKFFAFYGEIGIIAEIDRSDKQAVCWWTPDMKPTRGFHSYPTFKGDGFDQEDLELAISISKKIPMNYCRVDFIKSEDELVFGELEVNTGGFEKFPRVIDRMLGECYLKAENRLFFDIWQGKQYPEFVETAMKLEGFPEYWEKRKDHLAEEISAP